MQHLCQNLILPFIRWKQPISVFEKELRGDEIDDANNPLEIETGNANSSIAATPEERESAEMGKDDEEIDSFHAIYSPDHLSSFDTC